MFTLIRPVSAVFLAAFAHYAAYRYMPLYDPDAAVGSVPFYALGVGAIVGWLFVGGGIGRSVWFSVYMSVQGVVLTLIGTAMVLAVGEVFSLGYRRRFHEVLDAINGYFALILDWVSKALERDFVILLVVGGVVIGIVLHLVWALLEKRRNAR